MNLIETFEQQHNIKKFRADELERRKNNLNNIKKQKLHKSTLSTKKIEITYVMTWTGICGGSKIILEHANKLTELGHKVNIITHYPYPSWYNLSSKIIFQQIPLTQILCESIPKTSNIIITTYWREIGEAIEQKIAPVVYFEQGDFHLFDSQNVDTELFDYIYKQINLASFVYTVSSHAKKKLKDIYNVNSLIIPNAINKQIFYPVEKSESVVKKIVLIGSPNTEFKGIKEILTAISITKKQYPNLHVTLITPESPLSTLQNVDTIIINPAQQVIAQVLQESDIYICGSHYESFCLPVLEALSCGCSVITTNNGGINDFCVDNENCLIVEIKNPISISMALIDLIENNNKITDLSKQGIISSEKFSWDTIVKKIEAYYLDIANYEV